MSTSLEVVNIGRQAKRLERPFQMVRLTRVDELLVSLYLCQGAVAWHRHADEDELFLTSHGLITLETDWGATTLQPWEIALVPKGVGHRSLAAWPSTVLLIRADRLVDRKNGHRRLYAVSGQELLAKVSLVGSAERPAMPYRPQLLLEIEDFTLRLLRCVGQSPWMPPRSGDTLLLAQQGTMLWESEDTQVPLMGGELLRVPAHTAYRIAADTLTMLLELTREEPLQGLAASVTP